jgi:hypothetical protein
VINNGGAPGGDILLRLRRRGQILNFKPRLQAPLYTFKTFNV